MLFRSIHASETVYFIISPFITFLLFAAYITWGTMKIIALTAADCHIKQQQQQQQLRSFQEPQIENFLSEHIH